MIRERCTALCRLSEKLLCEGGCDLDVLIHEYGRAIIAVLVSSALFFMIGLNRGSIYYVISDRLSEMTVNKEFAKPDTVDRFIKKDEFSDAVRLKGTHVKCNKEVSIKGLFEAKDGFDIGKVMVYKIVSPEGTCTFDINDKYVFEKPGKYYLLIKAVSDTSESVSRPLGFYLAASY